MSDKRFGTIETIQAIFQFPDTFFDLIQVMDERKQISIPEFELLQRVERAALQASGYDRKRIRLAFRTDNLAGSGLMSIDKKEGVPYLFFDDALIQLLRSCDRSLRQDLTNAKLKSRLSSLRELKKQIVETGMIGSDPSFQEACQELSSEINSIIRLIHGNVRDLEIDLARRMEEISGEIALADKMTISRHFELLGEIININERHIIPTLEFLNRSLKLKDGQNLFETLEDLARDFRNSGYYEQADQIDRGLISLNETYKPIQAISKQVQDFVSKNSRALRQHNGMERAFDELRDLMSETQSSKLNRIMMQGDEFVKKTGFMAGLVSRNYPSVTGLYTDASTLQLFASDFRARIADAQREEVFEDLPEGRSSKVSKGVDAKHSEALIRWAREMDIPETRDLVRHLHERLSISFGDYGSFTDLLEVLAYLGTSKEHKSRIKTLNRLRDLDHADERYRYRIRRIVSTEEGREDA